MPQRGDERARRPVGRPPRECAAPARLNLRLEEDAYNDLRRAAFEQRRSMQSIVVEALDRALGRTPAA